MAQYAGNVEDIPISHNYFHKLSVCGFYWTGNKH